MACWSAEITRSILTSVSTKPERREVCIRTSRRTYHALCCTNKGMREEDSLCERSFYGVTAHDDYGRW